MRHMRTMFVGSLIFALVILAMGLIGAAPPSGDPVIPPPPKDGPVLDSLGWFSPAQRASLLGIVLQLEKDAGGAQLAVVTLNDCGGDHPKFRNDLFRSWQLGQKDVNNGFLILVCWQNGDSSRTLEQEVGYGFEGLIPDTTTSHLAQQYFVPVFKGKDSNEVIKSGAAADALIAMAKAYDAIIRADFAHPENRPAPPVPWQDQIGWLGWPNWIWVIIIVVTIIILFILACIFIPGFGEGVGDIVASSGSSSGSGGGGWGGGGGGSSGGGGGSSSF